jgi:transposase InsO family protein
VATAGKIAGDSAFRSWLPVYQRGMSTLGSNASVSRMTAVGHCGDNAACEGFFAMLKRERINHR